MKEQTRPLRIRQKLNTKNDIARIAFSLFSQHGYDRVSVEMIAAASGISRATFFNYFARKDLLLDELAAVRAERVKGMLEEFRTSGKNITPEGLLNLILQICAENARISLTSKKLLLEAVFKQMSSGSLMAARDHFIVALSEILGAMPGQKSSAKKRAETMFSLFLGTMLEWLMREDVSESWLVKTMRLRLQLLLEAAQ